MSNHWLIVEVDGDNMDIKPYCDGPDDSCIAWVECRYIHDFTDDEEDDGEGVSHNDFHKKMFFGWTVSTEQCALYSFHDAWIDSASDIASHLGAGRHPIDFEWEDEHTIYIHSIGR
jgi:hypothetical protein